MTDIRTLIGHSAPSTVPARSNTKSERSEAAEKSRYYPKRRAVLNAIPSPNELQQMITNALAALSRGVYWDRGSIINIVL